MTSPERVLAKICTSESHREHPAFPSHHFRRRGAEDRRNRRPDVGFEPCYSRSQSVRLRGQPHARNDLCKSMRGACWCWRRTGRERYYFTIQESALSLSHEWRVRLGSSHEAMLNISMVS